MQLTKEGVLAILRHRKALLQRLASPRAPEVSAECKQLDWLAGAGGPVFASIVDQLFLDDYGLGDMLDVLCESAFHESHSTSHKQPAARNIRHKYNPHMHYLADLHARACRLAPTSRGDSATVAVPHLRCALCRKGGPDRRPPEL